MEPLDSRTPALPGNDDGAVVFDMAPIDHEQIAQAADLAPPADVVRGVDPPAEMPLSEPQIHPPIGSGVSQLEAALQNARR